MSQLNTRNKKIVYGVIVFLGLAVAIFIWNNYQIQISERSRKLIKPPPFLTKTCGIENCHGLDITCGPNVPEICDMSYQLGDNCRQLASCQVVSGTCQLIKSPEFDACKACVESCEKQFVNDPSRSSYCESKCGPWTEESQ